jgi:hypothetical protein
VVLYTPRSAFRPAGWPNAATYATSGLRGSTRIFEIACVSARPRCVHVLPPSTERYTPSPCMMLPRMHVSPIPM